METIHEKTYKAMSGWLPLIVVLGLAGGAVAGFAAMKPFVGIACMAVILVMIFGFQAVAPNDARVLLLFGDYKGSITKSGFFWVNPFFSKKKISRRVRNFETGSQSVPQQKDSAGKILQHKGRTGGRPANGNTTEVGEELRKDIQERLGKAGVEVIEARISHLAYAPEIAAAMLQRQQAAAVVAARTKIVDGAVGMVQMALDHLKRDNIVDLDDERRAAMVSNLLVVLCSDKHTQPVVNTGTLYN